MALQGLTELPEKKETNLLPTLYEEFIFFPLVFSSALRNTDAWGLAAQSSRQIDLFMCQLNKTDRMDI